MNSRFAVATLAGTVVLFVVGYLLWGLAFADFMAGNAGSATGVIKDPPGFLWLLVGQIVGAALLTLVLGWRGVTDVATGLKTGAVFGLLMGLAVDATMYATANISNLTATLVDPVLVAIQMGLAGAVIGMMLGRSE